MKGVAEKPATVESSAPTTESTGTNEAPSQQIDSTAVTNGMSPSDTSLEDRLTNKQIANSHESQALSTERAFTGTTRFTRTVWLPQLVDRTGVKAKLEDGVLTVRIPKAVEKDSVKIDVE